MNRRRVVAEGQMTRVEICPCGGCQVTIGPVTITVHEGLIEELGETLAVALRDIRARRAEAPAGALPEPCPDPEPPPLIEPEPDPSDLN